MTSHKHFIKVLTIALIFALTASCRVSKRTKAPVNQIVRTEPFILIHTKIKRKWCDRNQTFCLGEEAESTASGFLVAYDPVRNVSLVGTAKHVCDHQPAQSEQVGPFGMPITVRGIDAEVKFIDTSSKVLTGKNPKKWMSAKHDLCFFFVGGKIGNNPMQVAVESPKKGDTVYNVAAPSGVWSTAAVPAFKGQLLGEVKEKDFNFFGISQFKGLHYYMTNIPAVPGSSGSPIVNEKGEIVSVIFAIPNTKSYTHISFGVPHKAIAEGLSAAKTKFKF